MDLINRQDAIDKAILVPIAKIVTEDKVIYRRIVFVEDIESLPSAERVGHWIEKEDPYGFFNSIPVCSECGCTIKMREKTNYCPNCGAHMEGEKE